MAKSDPCRRALTRVEEALLFAGDALRAARSVMTVNPASEANTAYLAVFALLTEAALSAQGEQSVTRTT